MKPLYLSSLSFVAGSLVVVLFYSSPATTQERPRSLDAEKVTIRDKTGRERIAMFVDQDDQATITIKAADDNFCATLRSMNEGASFYLTSRKKTLASLVAHANGAFVNLFDKSGVLRVTVQVDEESSLLSIYDHKGRPRGILGVKKQEGLRLINEAGDIVFARP